LNDVFDNVLAFPLSAPIEKRSSGWATTFPFYVNEKWDDFADDVAWGQLNLQVLEEAGV
jgi:hypothetical protein